MGFDFNQNLPAGVRCTAQINPKFKTTAGTALTGAASYQFQTGGPQVSSISPDTYESVDEQQYFALRLTGLPPRTVCKSVSGAPPKAWVNAFPCS